MMAAAAGVVEDQAFVTLATNDTYALGALVLGHSLRHVGTSRRLAIMVTPGVTQGIREQLSQVFDVITEVNVLDSRDTANLDLLTRPDLGVTFTKLHCWRLTQFSKCVFMDADTLVLQNIDELFEREELSAAPDAGWPDCFNSGVFVFCPCEQTYQALLQFAVSQGSFDGGDQGLLNLYFSDWATKDISKHLPFIYNVVSQAFYSYLPAFRQFGRNVKVAHFIGAQKPWHHTFNVQTGQVETSPDAGHNADFLQIWWNIFLDKVQPHLDNTLVGLVGELASLKIEQRSDSTYSYVQLHDANRQYAWERGQIDYLGIDSFDNIQARLNEVINGPPKTAAKPEPTAAAPAPAAAPTQAPKPAIKKPAASQSKPPKKS